MLSYASSLARGSERAERKAKAGRARESGLNLENDTEKETRKEDRGIGRKAEETERETAKIPKSETRTEVPRGTGGTCRTD